MILYFASRYGRRQELVQYKHELESRGIYQVNSRWLTGNHHLGPNMLPLVNDLDPYVELSGDEGYAAREKLLQEDLEDILNADGIVCFTEHPRSEHSRGGRHVKLGVVLGCNLYAERVAMSWSRKQIVVVGPKENLFYFHMDIIQFPTWEQCYRELHVLDQREPKIFKSRS